MSANQLSSEDVKLARSIVDPERSVRDAALKGVIDYVKSVDDMDDMEMLKLWKALYYCMWLADKAYVQNEITLALVNLSDAFSVSDLKLKYFRMFFRILLREWFQLDQHRINKFYFLIRSMIRKMFAFVYENKWSKSRAEGISEVIRNEILCKKPNGLRLHVTDIYLNELLSVTEKKLSTEQFIFWLNPFLELLSRRDDPSVIDRVSDKIFMNYIKDTGLPKIDLKVLQKKVFDLAADTKTIDNARTRLFALHKELALSTGVQFIGEAEFQQDRGEREESETTQKNKQTSDEPTERKNKRKKTSESVGSVDEEAQKESEGGRDSSQNIHKKTIKRQHKEKYSDDISMSGGKSKIPSSEGNKQTKMNSKQNQPAEQPIQEFKRAKHTDILAKSTDEIKQSKPIALEVFIASKTFQGKKTGYKFQRGPNGVGYYPDDNRFKAPHRTNKTASNFKGKKSKLH